MKKININNLIIVLVTASIFGFIMESLFVYASNGHLRSSGNHGQFYQMYGYCAVVGYILYTKVKLKPFHFFIITAIIVMVVEFVASVFLQYVLDKTAWSYCTEYTNIFCRTTVVRGSLISLVITLYFFYILPFFFRFAKDRFFLYACYFCAGFILIDSFIAVLNVVFTFVK